MSQPAKQIRPELTIRQATDADVLPMARVHIISWRETYPGLLPEPMLARLSVSNEAIRRQRMLDRPRSWGATVAFVAEQHGSIVGYGTCNEQRSIFLHRRGFTSEVSELYVLKDAQGLGGGSGLMRAMASALVDRGHEATSLWVLEQNKSARHFYESMGGKLIAEKRANFVEVAYGWRDLRTFALGAGNRNSNGDMKW